VQEKSLHDMLGRVENCDNKHSILLTNRASGLSDIGYVTTQSVSLITMSNTGICKKEVITHKKLVVCYNIMYTRGLCI
jgi:hypothetical protein